MAYLGRGEIRERRGDLQGALADFQRVLDLEPANAEALKAAEETRDRIKAAASRDRKKIPAETPGKMAKPRTLRMDQMDQMELMPAFGPK
jgi:tetratricopeptide (TPR) repeat protein